MSVKHNDERSEQEMREAKTSEGEEDRRRLKKGRGRVRALSELIVEQDVDGLRQSAV